MIKGKTISLCVRVKDEQQALFEMIKSVLPAVDEINVLIDDRTKDGTEKVARHYTNRVQFAKFEDFSQMRNESMKMATKDYILNLDADEKLLKEELFYFEQLVSKPEYDVWSLARIWYTDFEMKHIWPKKPFYPDWQPRLLKNVPYLYYQNKVHPVVVGAKKHGHSEKPTIRHFNLCYENEDKQQRLQKFLKGK